MFADLLQRLDSSTRRVAQSLRRHLLAATKPARAPLVAGALADLPRTKPQLRLENALLRQQVIILQRAIDARAAPPQIGRCWRCWPAASAPGARARS